MSANAYIGNVSDPKSYSEAMHSADKNDWLKAMHEELQSIEDNDTWTLTDLPPDRKSIGSKWVFKTKQDESGKLIRKKARVVAQGFTQKFGVDYDEVFAPVARSTTLRVLLSIAGKRNYSVKHYDIKTAFLNGHLDEEIYMRPPPGFKQDNRVFKLNKSLYGLKQAARVWNQTLHDVLVNLKFQQSDIDKCLYVLRERNTVCYLLVHVDDILLVSNDAEFIQITSKNIGIQFEIKDLGNVKHYLGIDVTKDKDGNFLLSQAQYIKKIIESSNLCDAKTSKFPLDQGYFKIEDKNILPDNNEYRKLIGMLLYLSTNSRPDISASVAILSQKVSQPTQTDMNEAKRIVKYLKGSINLKLSLSNVLGEQKLTVFSDANWAEERESR